MAGLQRSAVSFRRQGSSGLVWDDKILLGELNNDQKPDYPEQEQDKPENKTQNNISNEKQVSKDSATVAAVQSNDDGCVLERSRSSGGGGRGYRTGKVSPAVEPPSPRISACGFCGAFGKQNKNRRNRFGDGKRSRSR